MSVTQKGHPVQVTTRKDVSMTKIVSHPGTKRPNEVLRNLKIREEPSVISPSQEEKEFLADLLEEVYQVLWTMKEAPVIEQSSLDHGYYVFAVMRHNEWLCQSEVVYIGTADGTTRRNKSIFELQRKHRGSGVILLADGLSKTKSTNMRRVLIRRLKPSENGRK